ncbi:Sapep family Mn(2+)-dependent dipeptidase [Streptococcus respiraculi]|uniref:Sapep family Mn(2+)-dependent dipeptidase n=1 Tax=Streptococcus respiraculi TaxID=2021971 RepID=UPI000E73AEEE|nr:Sapep family Mn(2+)-dependent dipeptidase [Streptococcus respiraculi]
MNESLLIKRLEEIQPQLQAAIKRLVSVYSIEGEASPEAPFGAGPKAALLEVLTIAEELGFRTKNVDHKVGYAQYGEDHPAGYIGVFGHVDVVPIGEGWKHEPLGCEIENNRMYGRGVLDNKGPILTNLFALYVLKELGIEFPYPIRIVFGTNEETGFKCVTHYLTKEEPPLFGWTPDCKWPVVYGERGRVRIRLSSSEDYVNDFYQFINDFILSSTNDGRKLGIDFSDEDFGTVVMRGYQLRKEWGHSFEFSISYPASCTKEQLVAQIETHLPPTIHIEIVSNWDPVLYDKSSCYVQTLQQVYNECTGNDATPVTTTGGTFAKIVPNIIAYGPSYPGQTDIAHLPDEWIDLDDLKMNTCIYGLALARLKTVLEQEQKD